MDNNQDLNIKLSKDEALILFDFLSRFSEKEIEGVFQDQSEQKVLWIIEGQLEKVLVEPFMPDYSEIILKARDKIRDSE